MGNLNICSNVFTIDSLVLDLVVDKTNSEVAYGYSW